MMKIWCSLVAVLLLSVQVGFAQSDVIEDLVVYSDLDEGQVEARFSLKEDASLKGALMDVLIKYPDGTVEPHQNFELKDSTIFQVNPVVPWHPKTPNLYTLTATVTLEDGSTVSEVRRFGMRKFESKDGRFYINDKPYFVKACGHERQYNKLCQSDDRVLIERNLKQMKRYGFNTMRHHSHVPSETFLQVADEVGVLVQMEFDRYGKGFGDGIESEVFAESRANWVNMISLGRRHPSSFIYSMGNELYKNDPGLLECMDALYDLAKEMDPYVLVLNRSGSNPFNDDFGKFDLIERPIGEYEHTAEFARDAFDLYLRGSRKGRTDEVPIIAHEYPLVASYPNQELVGEYGEMPDWMKKTVEKARENGLEHLLPIYVKNTEAIQAVCRREMLEEARKFPELDGYSMLRFNDSTNYVSGVVTDFDEPKNVTAEEFLRTNGETVLLCTWNDRTFEYGDTVEAKIEISHHGEFAYTIEQCQWYLMNGPQVLEQGVFDSVTVDPLNTALVGYIRVQVPELFEPAKLTLRVFLPDSIPYINNEWSIWAFEPEILDEDRLEEVVIWDPVKRMKKLADAYDDMEYIDDPEWLLKDDDYSLVISDRWQEPFFEFLEKGGDIWIISDKTWPWPEEIGIFGMHITAMIPEQQAPPIFPELDEELSNWMTICSNAEYREGNSGTVIYPHPMLKDFPHDGFCDMQFWPLVYRAKSLSMDGFPKGTVPIIRTIDNYYRGRDKGYMVELNAGKGRLFISTLNINATIERSAATRYFVGSMVDYMTGPDWNPAVDLSMEDLRTMLDGYGEKIAPAYNKLNARYERLWKFRLSNTDHVTLPVLNAKGLDENRMGVHWEYAQTQYFFKAQPGDELSWTFEIDEECASELVLLMATELKEIKLFAAIDDEEKQSIVFPGTDDYHVFSSLTTKLGPLGVGEHTLTISVPEEADFHLQDVEVILKGKE
jgi:beta-galactosidase